MIGTCKVSSTPQTYNLFVPTNSSGDSQLRSEMGITVREENNEADDF